MIGTSQVLRLSVTDSTQAVARFLAEQGAPDRTLVWADRQTAGRGRLKRRWDSRLGGLYFSLILRPAFPPSRLAALSLARGATNTDLYTVQDFGARGDIGRRQGRAPVGRNVRRFRAAAARRIRLDGDGVAGLGRRLEFVDDGG